MPESPPLVRAAGVERSYPIRGGRRVVLAGLDLEVRRGEMVAVVGRSGSGKTTLLNILAGFDRGFTGRVEVAGRDLATLGEGQLAAYRSAAVGVVLQGGAAFDELDLLDNVTLPVHFQRGAQRRSWPEARQRALDLLAEVGLDGRAHDRARELSGGELQRLSLARALMNAPPILLCDEPTGNLDQVTAGGVVELLHRLRQEHGLTILVATHDPLLEDEAGRRLRLEDGVLVANGVR